MGYEIGTVITMNNNNKYLIFSQINYQNTNYYYVVGYDEEKKDINGICKIIKINKSGLNDYIELVNDKKELANVIPLFIEFYK